MSEGGPMFVVRPHKVRRIVIPVAVALVVVFAVVAVLLRNGSTGVRFGLSDQVSMVLIGLALGAATLVFLRPRVRADSDGVEVRNVLFGQRVPWTVIRAVSFPDGAPWARLELPEDEYVPVVAIQAVDGELAVKAIRELRAIHRESAKAPEASEAPKTSGAPGTPEAPAEPAEPGVTEKAAGKAAEQAAESDAEKAVEKAAGKAAEQADGPA